MDGHLAGVHSEPVAHQRRDEHMHQAADRIHEMHKYIYNQQDPNLKIMLRSSYSRSTIAVFFRWGTN